MNEVNFFKALSDSTRLKILEYIREGEKCICEIIPYTGKSQPCVSQHLKVMKNAEIINERKEGTKILVKSSNNKIYQIIDQVKNMK